MNYKLLKTLSISALILSAVSLCADPYTDLKNQAETAIKEKNAKLAIELYEKAVKIPDLSVSAQDYTLGRLSWLYAWGLPKNDFVKSADLYGKRIALPGVKPANKINLLNEMVTMYLRDKSYDRAKIADKALDMLKDSTLEAEQQGEIRLTAARILREIDENKSMEQIDSALKLPVSPALKNRILREAAVTKCKSKKTDLPGAIEYLRKITADSAISANLRVSAQLEIGSLLASGRRPNDKDALVEFEKVSQIANAPQNEIALAALRIGAIHERDKAFKAADLPDYYLKVARNEAFPPNQRMEGYKKAVAALAKVDPLAYDKQEAIYQEMYTVKGAKLADAIIPHSNLLFSLNKPQEALALFGKVDPLKENQWFYGQYAAAHAKAGQVDKAIELYRAKEMYPEIAALLIRDGKKEAAVNLLLEQLATNGKPQLLETLIRGSNSQEATALVKGRLKPILEKYPNLGKALIRNALGSGSYEYLVETSPYILKAETLDLKQRCMAAEEYIVALGQTNRSKEAAAFAADLVTKNEIKDPYYMLIFRLFDAAMKAKSPADVTASTKQLITETKDVETKKLPDAMTIAAQLLFMQNRRDLAEAMETYRKSLFTPTPTKSMPCLFVENLPEDPASWMNLKQIKEKTNVQKLDRGAWGANIEFILATDAAMARSVGKKDNERGIDSDLFTFCDAKGVYFFVIAYDAKAKAGSIGLADVGSYEGYFAPGKSQPYHCFLPGVVVPETSAEIPEFITAYPNPLTRRPNFQNGLAKCSGALVADNINVMLLFYPWEGLFNVLPDQKGDTYQFDLFRWTDSSSWSGTQSVHNRSTWGDVVFDLTPVQLTAIRRNIVYKAAAAYKKQCGGKWRGTGIFRFWNDPDLGDVAFYKTKLEPLQKQLDAELKKITPDMSDAEVNRIFLETVPSYFNLSYLVNQMREDYLRDQLFAQ